MSHSHDHEGLPVDRRRVLCGGGAAVFSTMIVSLLGGTKPVRAEPISGAVPEVDGLAVRVVTDSYQFAVAPSGKVDGVEIQHFGWGIGDDKPPGKTLISEFGLSMHVSRDAAGGTRHSHGFRFHIGGSINNTNLLGIEPAPRCARAEPWSLRPLRRAGGFLRHTKGS